MIIPIICILIIIFSIRKMYSIINSEYKKHDFNNLHESENCHDYIFDLYKNINNFYPRRVGIDIYI